MSQLACAPALCVVVATTVQKANSEINSDEVEAILKKLNPLLSRSELPVEGEGNETHSITMQDVALVLRNVAELVPSSKEFSIALARIATVALSLRNESLRISDDQIDEFGRIAKVGSLDEPEELFEWLIDKANVMPRSSQSGKTVSKDLT